MVVTGPPSVLDIVDLHSDPDDAESYSLLDRDWNRQPSHSTSTADNARKDKRKFDKILSRKDDELKVLTEKVQKQAEGVGEATAFMTESSALGPPVNRPRNCLSTISLSLPCLLISFIIILIVVPLVLYFTQTHTEPTSPPS